MRHLIRIAAVAVLVAQPLPAQRPDTPRDTTHHALAIPARSHALTCEELTPASAKGQRSARSVWKFEVGSPGGPPSRIRPRLIFAGFDSAGAPFILVDMVTLAAVRGDNVNVRFVGNTVVGRWNATRFDSATVSLMHAALASGGVPSLRNAIPKPEARDLSADEQQQARDLARWLWQHRCARASAR